VRPIYPMLAAALLPLGLAACGSSSSANPSATSTGVPSTVVVALANQTSPNWFFPETSLVAATVVNVQMASLMYKPLIMMNDQDEPNYERSLADAISWNTDGTVYTIHLNPKWHWSNGQPVTANDVVFTWNVMKAASAPNAPWAYSGQGFGGVPSLWQSVTAEGPHTVVVKLTTPRNPQWFIRNGLGQIFPVPAQVWNKYPHNMTAELQFINSVGNSPNNAVYKVVDGPYQFLGYQANNYWAFVPNPHYNGHRSTIKKLIFQYETSSASMFSSLKTGTVNVGFLPPSLIKSENQLTGDVIKPVYTLGFNYIVPNFSPQAPGGIAQAFRELDVRQALQMGIDQNAIIHDFYHGYAVMDDTTLAPKPPTPFFDPALAKNPYPFNPEAGKALLLAHGWREVNGVMTKNGIALKFDFIYASGSETATNIAELLKNDWAQEGIQVNLVSQPFDTVVSYSPANASKWALISWDQGSTGGWTYGTDPYPTGGGLFGTGGAENSGSYSDPVMDQLIQKTYAPGTPQQTLQALYAYEEYAAHQLPGLFIPWNATILVHSQSLTHVVQSFNPVGGIFSPNYWTWQP